MEFLGGQALIEGVLILFRKRVTVAVRKPDGKILVRQEKIRLRGSNVPFVRGITNLFIMLYTGVKMLNFSAQVAMGEEEQKDVKGGGTWGMVLTLLLSLAFGIALFKVLPLAMTSLIGQGVVLDQVGFSLVDGLLRVAIFIGYVYVLSFFKDVRRLFEYHGAEHAAIACYEARKPLTVENVRRCSTLHRRCGTAFIFLVFLVSVFVYAFIPRDVSFGVKLGLRVVLLPLVAAVSYEVLRLGARFRIFIPLVLPGLWIQKITTQRPDAQQIEVAIRAVNVAVRTG